MNIIDNGGDNNQQFAITVYNYGAVDSFVGKVREIYQQRDKDTKQKINEIIKYISEIAQPQCIQGEDNIPLELIGQGASSICHKAKGKIFKSFYPKDLVDAGVCEIIDSVGGAFKFIWLNERATNEQTDRFLKRYARFIFQKEVIDSLDIEGDNTFITPELKLTSHGFVWVVDNFNGCTLEEDFNENHIAPPNNPIKDSFYEISYRIEKIKQAAINIQAYCHGKKIYHSDIKPSNFFVIRSNKRTHCDIVRNIDFDSWMTKQRFKEGFLDLLSTTPLFYFDCPENVNTEQSIEKWFIYDIRALSRMLMYALLNNDERATIIEREFIRESDFDWIDFFFGSVSVKEQFVRFVALGLQGLYVFDIIKQLLFDCSPYALPQNVIRSIDIFIKRLENIENLLEALKSGNAPAVLNESAIRYLGLKRLDAENTALGRELRHSEYGELLEQWLSCDWVQYVVEKNYYKQGNNDYDAIDRHLIPDIDLGDGNKPLAYKFDDRGFPIASPLEQALEAVKGKSLFLTAEGGQGKTTALRSFWFDFLNGKLNTSCLYIDCKLLTSKNSLAIEQYIKDTYNFEVCKLKRLDEKLILLIDGVNESNVDFRNLINGSDCKLVKECKDLNGGFKLVIGSRSDAIHIANKTPKEEVRTLKRKENVHEFDEKDMQYVKACALRADQLERCLGYQYYNVKNKKQMVDLLHNNMMLHVFMNLRRYGVELKQEEMKAGILLDKYFDVCFKTRYVRSCITNMEEFDLADSRLYEKIRDFNCTTNENDATIKNALDQYDIIKQFLIGISMISSIEPHDLPDTIFPSAFDNLSILTRYDDKFVWTNEIYQEYFLALCVIEHIQDYILKGDVIVDPIIAVEYNALQYAGEILLYEYKENGFKNKIDTIISKYRLDDNFYEHIYSNYGIDTYYRFFTDMTMDKKSDFDDSFYQRAYLIYGDGIRVRFLTDAMVIMSVLCGFGIPRGITRIHPYMFSECDMLKNIEIPSWINHIEIGAFKGCNRLLDIKISKDIDIDMYAFYKCSMLRDVTLSNNAKINYIGYKAFYGCSRLKNIKIPDCSKLIKYGLFTRRYSLEGDLQKGIWVFDNVLLFEDMCMDVIGAIVLLSHEQDRRTAIKIAEKLLIRVNQRHKDDGRKKVFERVLREFKIATDQEYILLRNQLFS